jgi:hypothetical protein
VTSQRTSSALAIIAVLAAGCGGARSNPPAATAQRQRALAFAECMRSHGAPNYPDPNGSGELVKATPQQLGVSSPRLQTAQSACNHLLPNGGSGPTQAELQQSWSDFRSFARCMRRHGVSSWPDPTRYPQHPERPTFELRSAGIDLNSPRVTTKIHQCVPLLHGNNPQRLGEGEPQ